MSLEGILESFRHIGILASHGAYYGFRKVSFMTFVKDEIKLPVPIDTVLKKSVFEAFYLSSLYFTMGTGFFNPVLGLTMLCANAGCKVRDRMNRKENTTLEDKVVVEQKTSKDECASLHLRDRISNYCKWLKLRLCALGIVGVLALGHYGISELIERYRGFNPNTLNVTVRRFNYDYNGKNQEFYILGEMHLYNRSSYLYVKRVIEDKNITMLLSEGYDHTSNNRVNWRSLVESELGLVYSLVSASSGHNYPDPWEICTDKNIQKFSLEKIDTRTNGRQGVDDKDYAILGIVFTTTIATAPLCYFAFAPARYSKFPYLSGKYLPLNGIIDDRNKNMTQEAITRITENPESKSLIRVGAAHVDGILSEFSEKGQLTELPLQFKMD